MITDEKGLKLLREMNTHICEDCNKVFINFKGIYKHSIKFKHHKFKLKDSDLCLMVG